MRDLHDSVPLCTPYPCTAYTAGCSPPPQHPFRTLTDQVVQRREDYAPGTECVGLEFYHEACAEVLQSFVHWGRWVDVWLTEYGCLKVPGCRYSLARRASSLDVPLNYSHATPGLVDGQRAL